MNIPAALTSPLFGGGFLLLLSGAAMALLRNIPGKIYDLLMNQISVTVEILNSDPTFEWLTLWLNEHPYTKKARRLTVSTTKHNVKCDVGECDEQDMPKIVFSPSPGDHLLRYKGKFIWLSRNREKPATATGGFGEFRSLIRPEDFQLTVLGRSQDVIRELIADAYALMQRQQARGATVYIHTHSYWSRLRGFEPRPLESVILPGDMVQDILADVKEFLASRNWYFSRGIPYRRGYLLYGIAGSGKTSLIMGLSDELKMNIYVLNLGSRQLSDDNLPALMLDIPPRSLILMEDIDAVVPDRDLPPPTPTNVDVPEEAASQPCAPATANGVTKADKQQIPKAVSLSCLLNCLDGVVAGNGSVIFMTSNHPERLDPALIRPGRVDVRKEFGYVQPEQAEKLFPRFYPDANPVLQERTALVVKHVNVTMADLQRVFLTHKTDPHAAVTELEALLFVPVEK